LGIEVFHDGSGAPRDGPSLTISELS